MGTATAGSAALVAWAGSASWVRSGRSRAQAATCRTVDRPSSGSRTRAGAVMTMALSW
jgi:hypothetical protein